MCWNSSPPGAPARSDGWSRVIVSTLPGPGVHSTPGPCHRGLNGCTRVGRVRSAAWWSGGIAVSGAMGSVPVPAEWGTGAHEVSVCGGMRAVPEPVLLAAPIAVGIATPRTARSLHSAMAHCAARSRTRSRPAPDSASVIDMPESPDLRRLRMGLRPLQPPCAHGDCERSVRRLESCIVPLDGRTGGRTRRGGAGRPLTSARCASAGGTRRAASMPR